VAVLADNIARALTMQMGHERGKRLFARVVARYYLPDTDGEICSLALREHFRDLHGNTDAFDKAAIADGFNPASYERSH
jgi:hypothetical protein